MASLASAPTLNRRRAVRLGTGGLAAALALRGMRPAEALDRTVLEANKALVRRVFEEAVNGGNVAVLADLYAPDHVDRGAWARQMPRPAGMPLTLDEFRADFPDVHVALEGAIAEGDLVAARATWYGTHPPAGRHAAGRTMHFFRLSNERIVEQWSTGWEWLAQPGPRPAPRPRNPLAAPWLDDLRRPAADGSPRARAGRSGTGNVPV